MLEDGNVLVPDHVAAALFASRAARPRGGTTVVTVLQEGATRLYRSSTGT